MSETYAINGLQFSRPFRTIIEPHFQLLELVGAKDALLYGSSIWAIDHLQLRPEQPFNYLAFLPKAELMPMARKMQTTLANSAVVVTPRAKEVAIEFKARFNAKPLNIIFFHERMPSIAEVIEAAPTVAAAAIMTRHQQIEVSAAYNNARQQGGIAPQPNTSAKSHAFSWIYE